MLPPGNLPDGVPRRFSRIPCLDKHFVEELPGFVLSMLSGKGASSRVFTAGVRQNSSLCFLYDHCLGGDNGNSSHASPISRLIWLVLLSPGAS